MYKHLGKGPLETEKNSVISYVYLPLCKSQPYKNEVVSNFLEKRETLTQVNLVEAAVKEQRSILDIPKVHIEQLVMLHALKLQSNESNEVPPKNSTQPFPGVPFMLGNRKMKAKCS